MGVAGRSWEIGGRRTLRFARFEIQKGAGRASSPQPTQERGVFPKSAVGGAGGESSSPRGADADLSSRGRREGLGREAELRARSAHPSPPHPAASHCWNEENSSAEGSGRLSLARSCAAAFPGCPPAPPQPPPRGGRRGRHRRPSDLRPATAPAVPTDLPRLAGRKRESGGGVGKRSGEPRV